MSENFGEILRELRLKKGFGLREFAKKIDWLPSNLSNLENNRLNPPRDQKVLFSIAKALGLSQGTVNWNRFFDLAANGKEKVPADITKYLNETELMPLMFRTVANKKLSKDQIKKLIEDIKKM